MTDQELVAGLLKGKEAAQLFLYKNQREGMYRVAVWVLGYRDLEAEDAVQEALEQALKVLEKFEFRSSLQTWLNRICARQCYRRMETRRKNLLGIERDIAETLKLEAKGEDPLHRLLMEEQRSILQIAIKGLKDGCNKIVKMRDLEGLPYAVIAEKLKVPLGTVMSRLARCREKLKDAVQKIIRNQS